MLRRVVFRWWSVVAIGLWALVGLVDAQPLRVGEYREVSLLAPAGEPAGALPAHAPGLRWVAVLSQRLLLPPILGPDGYLYVAGERGVTAVDPQGEIRWHCAVGDVRFPPQRLPSGEWLAVLTRGGFTRIDADGWDHGRVHGPQVAVPPRLLADGTLVLLDREGDVHLMSVTGERHALVPLGGPARGQIARFPDGTLLAAGGAHVTRFDASGRVHYRIPVGAGVLAGPVAANDRFYVLTQDGRLAAYGLDGRLRARLTISRGRGAPDLVLSEGGLQMAVAGPRLVSFGKALERGFSFELDGTPGPLTRAADGVTVAITRAGTLYAIEPTGRARFRVPAHAQGMPRPVVGPDGTIYIASRDGRLSAWR